MANICSFSMKVKGTKENIEKFIDMMKQKGTVWMGRGAGVDFTDMEEVENGKYRCQIDGDTKWSVVSSMVLNAVSMRENPDMWFFGDDIDKTKLSFVTLFEACEQLKLDMEVYSEECGCGFQEHLMFIDGKIVADECVDYQEYDLDEYETKEEAEEVLEIDITDDEWDDGVVVRGGFDSWDFEI